jgi:hypothetical protein
MNVVMALIVPVLKALFGVLSPALKVLATDSIRALYVKALESSNPFDDFLIELVAAIMGIDLSGVAASVPGGATMPAAVKAVLMNASLSPGTSVTVTTTESPEVPGSAGN